MSDTTASPYRDEHGHGADDGAVHAHIASTQFYVGIFLALVALTVLTVGLSYIHLGAANLAVAIVIASMKAALVVTFFMHLKYDNRFNALIFVCSLLFIGVFFAYTINDTEHRGRIDATQGSTILPSTGERAPGGEPVKAKTEHGGAEGAGAGASGDHNAPPNAIPAGDVNKDEKAHGGEAPKGEDAPKGEEAPH